MPEPFPAAASVLTLETPGEPQTDTLSGLGGLLGTSHPKSHKQIWKQATWHAPRQVTWARGTGRLGKYIRPPSLLPRPLRSRGRERTVPVGGQPQGYLVPRAAGPCSARHSRQGPAPGGEECQVLGAGVRRGVWTEEMNRCPPPTAMGPRSSQASRQHPHGGDSCRTSPPRQGPGGRGALEVQKAPCSPASPGVGCRGTGSFADAEAEAARRPPRLGQEGHGPWSGRCSRAFPAPGEPGSLGQNHFLRLASLQSTALRPQPPAPSPFPGLRGVGVQSPSQGWLCGRLSSPPRQDGSPPSQCGDPAVSCKV